MAFKWSKSLSNTTPIMLSLAKKASTAISKDSVVQFDGSGDITTAGASDASVVGVWADTAIASGDADFADTTRKKVIVDPFALYEADVETGTMTLALVGTTVDYASSTGIDVSATSQNGVFLIGFISSTKALVILESDLNLSV